MHLIFDVFYNDELNEANVACIAFDSFKNSNIIFEKTITVNGISEYKSGSFYKRELPCIMKFINTIDIKEIESIVIDGYVFLGDKKEGLGAKLYHQLNNSIPIIGISKNEFKNNNDAILVIRGKSIKPIYVTSIGIDKIEASDIVKNMDGEYRLPNLVKMVDKLSRNI